MVIKTLSANREITRRMKTIYEGEENLEKYGREVCSASLQDLLPVLKHFYFQL